ncbi:MAG: hypothetical protein J0L84_07735 [Verrucomicrobia bacterium]|nr:hypothetical protein [Verrucomicrobiota bacterium]
MNVPFAWVLAAIPLLPFAAGVAAARGSAARAGRLSLLATTGSAVLALASGMGLLVTGPGSAPIPLPGDAFVGGVSLRLDTITAVMGLLVASLGMVITRFSRNYLSGDPRQARFFVWTNLTLAAVLTMAVAGDLMLILAAWVATSLCLHRLLMFHPHRTGAVFSARKKFVVSRLGDLCLLAAVIRLHRHYGTGELEPIFQAVAAGDVAPLPGVGFLLVVCACLKSAQFPFHSWLPDTLETPTPVSAFMHAGIINAGGFLVVRLSPLLVHAPGALELLVVVGTLTAAFGAVVMLAQPGVKRALAYSTIAQMGFMMLQCGLGAFGLALLHIVAHSLYKAHAFLNAGGTVGVQSQAAIRLQGSTLALGALASALCVALASTVLAAFKTGTGAGMEVFLLILTLALAYGLSGLWSAAGFRQSAVHGLAAATGIALLSVALHAASSALVAVPPGPRPPRALVSGVSAVFAGLFLFQALLWRSRQYPWGQALYVHALNGFYLGTWANRALGRLWPRHEFLLPAGARQVPQHPQH